MARWLAAAAAASALPGAACGLVPCNRCEVGIAVLGVGGLWSWMMTFSGRNMMLRVRLACFSTRICRI